MPNWVNNTVEISGDADDVATFITKASKPRPYIEDGVTVMVDKAFSFWNFVAPPEDKWELYFGTSGWVNGEKVGDNEWNWYGWNLNNWGCKWDAGEAEVDYDGGTSATVRFETPWDAPREIIDAIGKQHPELIINWHYVEEQGWGGEINLDNGEVSAIEWDIPDNHNDYELRLGECPCEWTDDWRFEDCPVKEVTNNEEVK